MRIAIALAILVLVSTLYFYQQRNNTKADVEADSQVVLDLPLIQRDMRLMRESMEKIGGMVIEQNTTLADVLVVLRQQQLLDERYHIEHMKALK